MSKPFHLGLDLCGTVGDYEAGFGVFVAADAGIEVSELPRATNWNFHQSGWPILDTAHYLSLHAKAVQNALYAEMPVIDGAVEAIQNLRDAGIKIRVITHRLIPGTKASTVLADTGDWLEAHGVEFDDICFVTDKLSVSCDLLIDDGPHNLLAYREAERRYLIFDAPYNREIPGDRVRNWSGAEFFILARAGKL